MAETIHVRGEGGHIFAMDLPLPEGITDRYERGLLVRVNADGSPYAGAPAGGQEEDGTTPSNGSALTDGRTPRPAVNDTKAEWIAYVVGRGLLPAEDAGALTKADLIDLVGA
ncbi:hypothetical protein ACIO3R_32305 [Streptomyces sp. NPDC087428]|uniref:hypothetical protein n=1 Tax=Streptomyces sp. NPDC087428 TaxID=3365788 RepID=UPI003808672A